MGSVTSIARFFFPCACAFVSLCMSVFLSSFSFSGSVSVVSSRGSFLGSTSRARTAMLVNPCSTI